MVKMSSIYETFVGRNGSIDIPLGAPLEERRKLLEVGAGQALQEYRGRAFKVIQKKLLDIETEVATIKQARYDKKILERLYNLDK